MSKMLSLEEKQALLIKRWKAIHNMKPVVVASSPEVDESLRRDKIIKNLATTIWEASGRDLKSIVPPGVKNQSWYLLNLTGKIDWYGNVAIGRDKYFDGWWNAVPPSGCSISYFGPGAEGRCREMAEKIKSYYP